MIDCISFAVGQPLSAKPSKIVSGQEPQKTNDFLQALAQVVDKKVGKYQIWTRRVRGKTILEQLVCTKSFTGHRQKREQKAAHPRAMLSFKTAEFANLIIWKQFKDVVENFRKIKSLLHTYWPAIGKSGFNPRPGHTGPEWNHFVQKLFYVILLT